MDALGGDPTTRQDDSMQDSGAEHGEKATSADAGHTPMETDDTGVDPTAQTTTAAGTTVAPGGAPTDGGDSFAADTAKSSEESDDSKSQPVAGHQSSVTDSASLGTQEKAGQKTNNELSKSTPDTVTKPPQHVVDPEDAKWHTVGIFQGLSTTVTNFIDNRNWSSSSIELTADQLPDLAKFQRINLEPGTAYRFRLRAINSCGASEWSEISSFKTCLPGFPGAPSAIKISKSSEGAHLTWEPPPTCQSSNEIVEYSVYLAVKPAKEKAQASGISPQRMPAQLAFVRVYVGAANQCTVSHTSLAAAHVDCSNKPAIIFRIAARNEKGYGPATQVRWLQDPVQSAASAAAAAAAGAAGSSLLSPTRIKSELGGASPSKRFKAGSATSRMPPPSQAGDN